MLNDASVGSSDDIPLIICYIDGAVLYISIPLIPSLRCRSHKCIFQNQVAVLKEILMFFKHKVLLIIWEFHILYFNYTHFQVLPGPFSSLLWPPTHTKKRRKSKFNLCFPVLFWSMVIHSVSSPLKKYSLSPSSETININFIKSQSILRKHGSIYDKMWQISQYNCKWNKLIIQFNFIS